jgi:flagellin-like hook-associated protein FlgL
MRISSNMSVDNFVIHQQRLASELARTQNEIITLKSVNVPSDNPLETSRILAFGRDVQSSEQVVDNLRVARDFTNEADASLDEVTNHLDRIKELTLGIISSVSLPAERQAALVEIDAIEESLLRIANKSYLGMHLFGGQTFDTAPVLKDLGGIHFVGSTERLQGRLSIEGDETYGVTADEVFGMRSLRVRGADLTPAVTTATRVDELDGAAGRGIRLGVLNFVEDGPAGGFAVDLTGAATVGDIIDRINARAGEVGSSLTAELRADGVGLAITPGDPVLISALDNEDVAVDLGLITNLPSAVVIDGLALNRRVTPTTPLDELLLGNGIDTSSPFIITNGESSASVDLTPAVNVQDMLQLIEATRLGVEANVTDDGHAIELLNAVSGTVMTVIEDGGTLAETLGLRTLSAETALADLNFGAGVGRVLGRADLQVVTRSGAEFEVNLDDAVTVQDVIDTIQSAATAETVDVTASLNAAGTGVVLQDGTTGSGVFEVRPVGNSTAYSDLGLAVMGTTPSGDIEGNDIGGVRVPGVFGVIEGLRQAIDQGSEREITTAGSQIDEHITHIARVRGEIGARVRDYEARIDETQAITDSTSALLAEVQGVSLEEALIRFQTVQNALQASLVAGGQSLNLSLLNFLG